MKSNNIVIATVVNILSSDIILTASGIEKEVRKLELVLYGMAPPTQGRDSFHITSLLFYILPIIITCLNDVCDVNAVERTRVVASTYEE